MLQVNLVGAGSLLIHSARRLRAQGAGTLVVLSSVAGERPRAANVVYGASKAGLDALAQGLGDALHDDGVRVLVVRAGFVRTRMTQGLKPAPLSTAPRALAGVVGGRTGPRRPHGVGAAGFTLADDRRARASPSHLPPPATVSAAKPLRDISHLHARRHEARRRRHLLRVDVGIGLLVAAVALLLAPGVAIVAVAALGVLAVCVVSILRERRRSRRRAASTTF